MKLYMVYVPIDPAIQEIEEGGQCEATNLGPAWETQLRQS